MDSLFSLLMSFPTAPYFYFLIILLVYWLIVSFGLLDIELFDLDIELDTEDDLDSGSEHWLSKLGLDGVPLTVAITFLDIYALAFTYLGRKYLMPLFDGLLTATATGALVAVFSLLLAIPLSALCIKPLRQAFTTHEAVSKRDLVGTICTVTTSRVNPTFGQAETPDGMLLNIRSDTPNSMTKGSKVALIEFNKESDCYSVVTEEELMAMASSS